MILFIKRCRVFLSIFISLFYKYRTSAFYFMYLYIQDFFSLSYFKRLRYLWTLWSLLTLLICIFLFANNFPYNIAINIYYDLFYYSFVLFKLLIIRLWNNKIYNHIHISISNDSLDSWYYPFCQLIPSSCLFLEK